LERIVPRILKTIKAVAVHYGVRPDTVSKDWRTQGMPGSPGKYDLDEIDKWRAMRDSQKDRSGTLNIYSPGEQLPLIEDVAENKARQIAADASKKEAEARLKTLQVIRAENADIVELDRVESFLTELFAAARKRFMRIPVKLKRFGPDVQKACLQQIELELHAVKKQAERLIDLRDE